MHDEKILVVVKAAPIPSIKHRETVCTVGITENGKWIRLYPIPFRYTKLSQWFSKYQWIEVKIRKNEKDFRIDSYRPEVKSILPIGKPLPTRKDKWGERKKIVLPTASPHLEKLLSDYEKHSVSLGIFKPKKIEKLYIETSKEEWSEKHQRVLTQSVLFGKQPKKLEKVPYDFSYKFHCNNSACNGHKLKIIDWEIYELFRKMRDKYYPAMDTVLEKVKQEWHDRMWASDRDSYLIVGTVFPRKAFIVLGVFWPPK